MTIAPRERFVSRIAFTMPGTGSAELSSADDGAAGMIRCAPPQFTPLHGSSARFGKRLHLLGGLWERLENFIEEARDDS